MGSYKEGSEKVRENTYRLLITSSGGNTFTDPIVTEGIRWTTHRQGAAGRLDFTVIGCNEEHFAEGDKAELFCRGRPVFCGYIFTRKRAKGRIAQITAFDQLRYLKNKDTYVYENKTASELLQMIASDFGLQTGEIEDTGYKIPARVEENTALFDMLETALALTKESTGKSFVMYDDCGRISLKNIGSMAVKRGSGYLLIDEKGGENFEYGSSIDLGTYNKIKLVFDSEGAGKREVYIAQDGGNINSWGVLQYFDALREWENGQAKAQSLLKLYNAKTRKLKITRIFGDPNVRAGSLVAVRLNLGDVFVNNFMMVEKAVHTFKTDEHFMDLTLIGGDFTA